MIVLTFEPHLRLMRLPLSTNCNLSADLALRAFEEPAVVIRITHD